MPKNQRIGYRGQLIPKRYRIPLLKGLNECCEYLSGNFNIKSMVEVGCYTGESTVVFANCFKEATIYAVDIWRKKLSNVEELFDARVRWHTNIEKIKQPSVMASKRFEDSSLDFVYIDGNHSYSSVRQDILKWLPKIKKDGVIGGHDFHYEGVAGAVQANLGPPVQVFQDTSWVIPCAKILKPPRFY